MKQIVNNLQQKKHTLDSENVMNLFQTYQEFYKKQIEELEAQLINSKLELANKSADIDVLHIKKIISKKKKNEFFFSKNNSNISTMPRSKRK